MRKCIELKYIKKVICHLTQTGILPSEPFSRLSVGQILLAIVENHRRNEVVILCYLLF